MTDPQPRIAFDVNVFVVEALRWTDEDQRVLDELSKQDRPIIAVLNKADKVFPKERLLPFIEELGRRARFAEIVPLSALKRSNIEQLPTTRAPSLSTVASSRSARSQIPPRCHGRRSGWTS